MQFTFRPIDSWPGPLTKNREGSPFRAPYQSTLRALDRELSALNAKHVVIQLALPEAELRLDGLPRASAVPDHPGVILSFDSKHGPLRYLTDRYTGATWGRGRADDWHHNLRAIVLGLEALRRVERYGITKRGEQYTGWKALPAGIAVGEAQFSSIEDAARFIAKHSGQDWTDEIEGDPFFALVIYKDAARSLHPDAGGTTEEFQRLNAARDLLTSMQ